MRALGRLVRGLSALFWGLPLALVICVYTATSDWLRPVQMLPPILVNGLLFYGVALLSDFQKQERVWREAVDRAKIVGLVNVGLSPFIFWWNQLPNVVFYSLAVSLLMLTAILFLFNLNYVLQRLSAMLPDETLRTETKVFGNLNISLLTAIIVLFTAFFVLRQLSFLPGAIHQFLDVLEFVRYWLLVFLVLLPIAMTMTLIWKIKEVVFASVFSHEGQD